MKRARNAGSSAQGSSRLSWERSVSQPSPTASCSSAASSGFASASQRRWVTPLVLLLNRSGYSSYHSCRAVSFNISVCRRATPLVEWVAKMAIRAICTMPSSRMA